MTDVKWGNWNLQLIYFLLLAPLVAAAAVFLIPKKRQKLLFSGIFSVVMCAASIIFFAMYLSVEGKAIESGWDSSAVFYTIGMFAGFCVLLAGVIKGNLLTSVLAAVQLWLFGKGIWTGYGIKPEHGFYVDRLSLTVVLLVSIVGSLLIVKLAAEVRKSGSSPLGFQKRAEKNSNQGPESGSDQWKKQLVEQPRETLTALLGEGRSQLILPSAFVLLSVGVGIALCDYLPWIPALMTVGGLCSFVVLGAERGMRLLNSALIASSFLLLGLAPLEEFYQTLSLQRLVVLGAAGVSVAVPLSLFCAAALAIASQAPFSRVLLEAKAFSGPGAALAVCTGLPILGAMFILRISPALGGTAAGTLTISAGAITMLCGAGCALCGERITAGRVVNAMLGAVVLLGGMSLAQGLWAGSLLLVFLCVAGSLYISQEGTGSGFGRMSGGLLVLVLAAVVIAKKSTLSTLVGSGNLILLLVMILAVSALILAGTGIDENRDEEGKKIGFWSGLISTVLAGLEVALCVALPLLSRLLAGFASDAFSNVPEDFSPLYQGDIALAVILTAAAVILWRTGKQRSVNGSAADWLTGAVPGPARWRGPAVLWIGRIGTVLSACLFCVVLAALWGGVL